MSDTDAARIGDVKAGLAAAKQDTSSRLKRDGSNPDMTPAQAAAFRQAIGAAAVFDPIVPDISATAQTGPAGSGASVFVGGTPEAPILAFTIPAGPGGQNGLSAEMRATATHIQWRQEGGAWADLVALASLKGEDGAEVQLRATATHIQWQYVGDTSWANLVAKSELQGPPGAGAPLATVAEVRAGAVDGKFISPKVMADALAPVVIARATAAAGMNFDSFINCNIPLDANVTLGPPSGGYPGKSGFLTLSQNATGGWLVAMPSQYVLPEGGITQKTTSNGKTRIPYVMGGSLEVVLWPTTKWA